MVHYETIMVGVDFTELSRTAVRAAVQRGRDAGAKRLHLVHVLHAPSPPASIAFDDSLLHASKRVLEDVRAQLLAYEVPDTTMRVTREVRAGPAARELALAAEEVGAELAVVATHERGPLKRAVIGSVAGALVRTVHCPLLVVGRDRPALSPLRTVIAAIDLSEVSEQVVLHAAEIARAGGGLLVVASAYDLPGASPGELLAFGRRYRNAVVDFVERAAGTSAAVKIEVVHHKAPSHFILEGLAGEGPDLVVIGTSGHNAWQRMILGSTATRVVAEAHCPVLVIPHDAGEMKARDVVPVFGVVRALQG